MIACGQNARILGNLREIGGLLVVGIDGGVHVIIADIHLHAAGHVALQGGDAVLASAKGHHVVHQRGVNGLVVGAAVHQDEAGLGDIGGSVHALVAAQELAYAGLHDVIYTLHGEEAFVSVVAGLEEVFQLGHGNAGLDHAPGCVTCAPAEANALAAPFGVLVHPVKRLAGEGFPLGVGNVQHIPDDLRRLDDLLLNEHRRRRGRRGCQRRRAQEQERQQQGCEPQHVFHGVGLLSCGHCGQ